MYSSLITAVMILIAVECSADSLSNNLVHVQGKFVNVHSSSTRAPYWVFTFHIESQLNGSEQIATAMDKNVRFALSADHDGNDLLAKIIGTPELNSTEDIIKALPTSPVFRLAVCQI
jgi:hypothetical protein